MSLDRDQLAAGTAGTETGMPLRRRAGPPGTAAAPRRRRGPSLAVVLLVLLTASFGAGAALWFLELGPAAYTAVPDVVGETEEVAAGTLDLNGLGVDRRPTPDEEAPPGQVVATEPGPGERIHKEGTVTLVVSSGPELFGVPELAGLSVEEATAALAEGSLAVGTVTELYDEAVPAGQVISSEPAAGEELRTGSTVDLTVSLGPAPVEIPQLVGLSEQDARAALDAAGLSLGDVSTEFEDGQPAGVVISQEPTSGTAERGDSVSIVVSLGPELIEVPNVTGERISRARRELEQLGFVVEQEGGGFFSVVVDQDPPGGTELERGSTVKLTTV